MLLNSVTKIVRKVVEGFRQYAQCVRDEPQAQVAYDFRVDFCTPYVLLFANMFIILLCTGVLFSAASGNFY